MAFLGCLCDDTNLNNISTFFVYVVDDIVATVICRSYIYLINLPFKL